MSWHIFSCISVPVQIIPDLVLTRHLTLAIYICTGINQLLYELARVIARMYQDLSKRQVHAFGNNNDGTLGSDGAYWGSSTVSVVLR